MDINEEYKRLRAKGYTPQNALRQARGTARAEEAPPIEGDVQAKTKGWRESEREGERKGKQMGRENL